MKIVANRHIRQGTEWSAPEGTVETLKPTGSEPLRLELELCREACTQRISPAVNGEAGLQALRVVEAARQSSQLGRRVLLSELC